MADPRRLDADLLHAAGATLGEGPAWDEATGTLVWVDIDQGHIHRSGYDGKPLAEIRVDGHVSAALPTRTDALLVARPWGFGLVMPEGAEEILVEIEADRPASRFNDAKVDPQGRLWGGTMRYDHALGEGTLYRLDGDLDPFPAATGRGLCNGLDWSPDQRTMYFVDTLAAAVSAFAFRPEDGSISDERLFLDLTGAPGLPDGMCVDDEGCLWIALHGGGEVRRYTPQADLDTVVTVPTENVTSVAFGGPSRDRLFITTASHQLSQADRAARPEAGALFSVDPGVSGPVARPWEPADAQTACRKDTTRTRAQRGQRKRRTT